MGASGRDERRTRRSGAIGNVTEGTSGPGSVRSTVLGGLLLALALSGCFAGEDQSMELESGDWGVIEVLPGPDGERAAFFTRDPVLLITRLVLAGDEQTVLSPIGTHVRAAAWMPNGERILLAYADGLSTSDPTRLALVDLEGEVVREFPVSEDLNASYGLAVSPDAERAVFPATAAGPTEGEGDLWSLDLESGRLQPLELRGADPGVQQYPVFVDDERVAFGAGELSWEFGGPNGWIAVLDLRTNEVVRLTEPTQTALTPSVTPDREFVVYDAFPGNERSKRGLWYVPVDGSHAPRELLEQLPGRLPALHSSGEWLYVIDAGMPGDRPRALTVEVPEEAPWLSESPDGS